MRIKQICTLLLAGAALCTFAGCQSGDTPNTVTTEAVTTAAPETEAPPFAIKLAELSDYVLVRPEETDDTLIDAATGLLKAINDTCSSSMAIKTDFYKEGMKGYEIVDREILIGATNRPQTAAFLAGLKADDYGYGIVDGKLVIAGHTSEATAQAVSLFRLNVLGAGAATRTDFFTEGEGKIKTGIYDVESMTLCGRPIGEYTIVYAAGNKAFEKHLAELLADHIAEMSGDVMQVVASSKAEGVKAKICVGDTGASAVSALAGQYLLGADTSSEPTVVAAGADSVGNAEAVLALIEQLTPADGAKTVECTLAAPALTKIDDKTMSAMSFNVYVGNVVPERQARVLYQIETHLPDTFGVQEASDTWMTYLKRELDGYYACVGIGRDNGSGEHSAVFYAKDKFNLIDSGTKWLSDTPDVTSKFPSSSLNRIFSYAILERKSDGARFMHVNTHFDHKSEEARGQQAGVLLDFIAQYPDLPIICTGDFNTGYMGTIYKSLVAGRLGDAAELAPDAERAATFHNYGKSATIIDFCFVTDDKIKAAYYDVCDDPVMGDYASDHHPVYIEYQLIG
ncbi:MAG: endonuclease/exonuclease/phosphatase family protein [Clostridia bacterium]|nr:endonuclease/exonuclease/phosphatase family protein [Clostridia bacterium]